MRFMFEFILFVFFADVCRLFKLNRDKFKEFEMSGTGDTGQELPGKLSDKVFHFTFSMYIYFC